MPLYLDRYLRGECESVWKALLDLKDVVRTDPFYADALEVSRETMRRVRYDIELLIARLEQIGYQFGYAWADKRLADKIKQEPPLLGNPQPDIKERLDRLEQAGAVLPLSIRAFYEIVGAVNFVGARTRAMDIFEYGDAGITDQDQNLIPHIDEDIDALYVLELDPALTPEAFRNWQLNERAPYTLPITRSAQSKYFISAGGASLINLPNLDADVRMFLGGSYGTTFVEYLRNAIRNGGLPPRGDVQVLEDKTIAYLTRDLLVF
jgi:hypothetical protein